MPEHLPVAISSNVTPFNLPGRFWRGNIHTHSDLSDGKLAPARVIDAYRESGYDFAMLSEHFMKEFNWPVADTRAFRSNNFTTLIGAELHAPQNSVGEIWHIVAAGLPLDFAPCGDDETGVELARRAAGAGAFVAIAHPSWSRLTMEDGRAMAFAHAVEVYNHGCAVENGRGYGWYLLDQMLFEGHRLTACATDDAHFRDHDADAFGGWVHVKSQSLDPDEILEALKKGHYYSSQGPQIHDLAITGDELAISCSPVDTISVAGRTSRTVVRTGKALTGAVLDLNKLTTAWQPGDSTSWLAVTLIDHAGKHAWTNPVWRDTL